MLRATSTDREFVVKILAEAFFDNKSFNSIVKQDDKKKTRIQKIFEYYFDILIEQGLIYLSDDKKACAMISVSGKKKRGIKALLMDMNLLFVLGIRSALKGFRREKLVVKVHPKSKYYYLLFLGVFPEVQGQGIGTRLMTELTINNPDLNQPICLETYLHKNVTFYQKFGFKIYHQMNFGFPLYFMMRDI